MRKILFFFLVFITGNVFSENTIIAIVNNIPISLNSVKNELSFSSSNEEKIEIVNSQIYITLQLQKVDELNLLPNENNINQVLIDIARSNKISIDEILNFNNIDSIKKEI